ncbi:head-tail connector protein [Lacticaseibacillus suibinensis]|uniref:head-tail connector protein n=1 Tax=Lacticaseibacillus suibinensis TaxID=2486011 RepID=UPI0019455DFB|nr:head-tail connector protein [Lacticaseibacillus suibinensis]
MAESNAHGPLTEDQFDVLKMYCKVDQEVEDDMLDLLTSGAAAQIASAVQTGMKPELLLSNAETRDRYFVAIMQQVKEEYDYRGEGADVMRYPLLDTVAATVNQLRTEVADDAND